MKKLIILFLFISSNLFGQVTYIGLRLPSIFTVSGSPITSQGNFVVTFANDQTAARVLATPADAIGAVGLRLIKNAHIDASAAIAATKLQSTIMVEGDTLIAVMDKDNDYMRFYSKNSFSLVRSVDFVPYMIPHNEYNFLYGSWFVKRQPPTPIIIRY